MTAPPPREDADGRTGVRRVSPTRIVVFAGLVQATIGLILPPLYQRLLRLPPPEAQVVRWTFTALMPLVVLTALVVVRIGMRGVPAPDDAGAARARRRVLQLPLQLGLAVLAVEALALIAMVAALVGARTPMPVVVGLFLCSAAVLALPPVPLYAFARVSLLPLAVRLGDEKPPEGRRISLALQLGYSIVAVASAALVPAAVFGAAQLDVAAASDARSRAQSTGVRLQRAAEGLEVATATTLLTRTPLTGGERTLFRAPSGTLLPEESVAELADLPYVEVPLTGALRGGTLRVYYAARPLPRAPLLVAILVLLLITLLVASGVGATVARDLRGLTYQIDRVARDEEPGSVRPVSTVEMRRVTRAANRLLERVPRFTVESFLAIERAEEAQRLKSQFLANMSHDLRSPLNSILGFSELLLRGIEGNISPRQRTELTVVQDRGNQLLRLLTEILDTAKLESGKMELHRHATPPAELLRQAVQEARRGRPASVGDRLQVSLQPGLQPLHVDPLRVTQAVTHLLNYALDACKGKVALRAREGDGSGGRAFLVEVEHDGELSADLQSHLFDAFRKITGNADLHLALPLARRLVELHGGRLELTSTNPARFQMIVPLR